MKRSAFFSIIVFFFISCHGNHKAADDAAWVSDPRDKEIFGEVLQKTGSGASLSTGELVLKIARHFEGVPYVASTLEKGDTEKLVINLREFDCTTFAESCLALARTIKRKNSDFASFAKQLELIRYRQGIRDGYPSRLHYFSDWIYDNDQKKVAGSVSKEIAHTMIPNRVNFMSSHPESYPILKRNHSYIAELSRQENEISRRMTWYIPKEKLKEAEAKIKDGDIIGITTNLEGLDISHVVIAQRRRDGRLGFIHASSKEKKVVVSDVCLSDYLKESKMASGIMVARPH